MTDFINQAPCFYIEATNGIIRQTNSTACDSLGYLPNELTGKPIESIFTLATRIFYQTHFFPLLRMQEHVEEIYITLLSKSKQEIPLLLNAKSFKDSQAATDVFVGIPVFNRKKFEDELVAAKKSAEQALLENTELSKAKSSLQNHMEQLDYQLSTVQKQNTELKQFNKVITHDLQEPLRKLSFFTSLLRENDAEKYSKLKVVERIARVSAQMQEVVAGLQQYIWINDANLKLERIDLNEVVSTTISDLKKEFPGVDILLTCDALPVLKADDQQIRLLFYHLFSNSVKFRQQGKPAEIVVRADKLQLNRFKRITDKYNFKDYLRIEVSDRGAGFDNTYSHHVFELFKRLHSNSGRGLGLALCKKIVENHLGDISIESENKKGTTVRIHLPCDDE